MSSNEAIARTLAVVGLGGVALIHLLDAHDTFIAAPYKGWLYVGLIAGCLTTAAVLASRHDPRAWLAALLLPLGAFVAFVVSRTVGLPYVADADPLQALDDAVRLFGPHEIVVAVQARGRANWRARDLVRRAERRLGRPVRHALA